MEIYYGSKGIDNYIEASLGKGLIVKGSPNNYRLKILENNDIEGLIKPVCMELDGCLTLKYNTYSCYVLERLFMKLKPDGGFLSIIMKQLEKLLGTLKAYLLEPNDLVLKPEYMFYDWGEKRLRLIYIPGYGANIKCQLKAFLEYVMRIFDHRDEAGVRYMYGVYDLVCEDTFSLDELSAGCLEIKVAYNKQLKSLEKSSDKKAAVDNCEKDSFLVGDGDAAKEVRQMDEYKEKTITKLVPLTNGSLKEILLSKYDEMILVGRGKRENDYRIPTTQISRVHACIYLRGKTVYVEDRESTNGTFINSVRLDPLKQERILVGDMVSFANEEFFAV